MPTDFCVDEILGFQPDGDGEHLWVQIRKTGLNTREVVDWLVARFAVSARDIGYSGLKDKNAVTTQWFSLPLPLSEEITEPESGHDAIEILHQTRSRKKIRIGSHRQNRFQITLRDLPAARNLLEQRLERINKQGFPNYFGPQRFGHGGRNVAAARSMFQSGRKKISRFKRGLYLSAARAFLFNQVLAARVENESWLEILPGEVCVLDGTNSVFSCTEPNEEIQQRHQQKDIHASGPLYGRGESLASGSVLQLEADSLQLEPVLTSGLEMAGLKHERRALRSIARDLHWQWLSDDVLKIEVTLQRGVYATAMLGTLVQLREVERPSTGESIE